MNRYRLLILLTAALAALPVLSGGGASAQPAGLLRLPFAGGSAWKIVQGYQGGTHGMGPERFGLDLVRDDGPTAGADILSPAAGTIWWMNSPGSGNGCLSIKIDNGGGLIVQLCHIVASAYRVEERIEAGQRLGTIGAAGTVGNNGLAHLHLSMHRTPDLGITRVPAPFALPDGLPLDGVSLPPDGSSNQYACPGSGCRGALVSTNGGGRAVPPIPPTAAALSTGSAPAIAPVAAAPAPAALPLRPGVIARVNGGGDCVNVREGPGLAAPVRACLPDNFLALVAQGPVSGDGRAWWRLDNLGWAAGELLVGVSTAPPSIQTGGGVIVDAGEQDCLNLRDAPSTTAAVLTCLPNGARLTVTDGPREADGHTWWRLDGRGWAAAAFLTPRE